MISTAGQTRSFAILFLVALCSLLIQVASTEDIIWYTGSSDYSTGHKYAWQGTTDGKSAPELLIASVINQPWLVAISKSKNIIYWTDNKGVIGAWNISSQQPSIVHQFNIGNWDEYSNGPALTGIDVDELNNHLYFTFNQSIYRLDISQMNPSPLLIASYGNKVFNPRFSASRNSLFFCLRNNFKEQGDLVQVSLSDPTTITTLVYNTSTGSIVQQLFIDDTTNTLYYNSPGTLTMFGVSLTAPYQQVFKSIYLSTNPTFFDFNPTTTTFIFGNLRFTSASKWSLGPNSPTTIYQPSYGRVTGVKFFNDTHALVVYQYPGNSANPGEGSLNLVNLNNPNDTSVLLHNFGMGASLLFDEKYCDFYYFANHHHSSSTDQRILRKNIKAVEPSIYQSEVTSNYNGMSGITLDVNKRNLIVASSQNASNTISYFPIDKPGAPSVPIIDSKGRSIGGYVVNDKTGDIYYIVYAGYLYDIYLLEASAITKDWIDNVGRLIIGGIRTVNTISMAVDSVNNKFYFSNNSIIMQSNLDGSDLTTFFTLLDKNGRITSMKWDPTSNRLFFLATPKSGWIMVSVNNNALDAIITPLNTSTSSGRDLFSVISPDPLSDWVYMNAEYYSPLRIKKDGSLVEPLNSYIPFSYTLGSTAFDETTGYLYYNDVCNKKINVSNINRNDPNATPFETAWDCDNEFSSAQFVHDRVNKMFWLLRSHQNTTNVAYTVGVKSINGGPPKQLFDFPKNVNGPFAIDTTKSKMFAYYFTTDRWNQKTDQAIVMMDLYNGSNLGTVKHFTGNDYAGFSLTAMTFDTRTNLLFYALSSYGGTALESFDPVTYKTNRLWSVKKMYNVRDMKIKGSSIYMAMYYGNIFVYDLNNGTATDLLVAASAISLDPNSDTIYIAGSFSISAANVNNVNATQTTLLSTFTITNIAFDFSSRSTYFTLRRSTIRNIPPYYYRSDLDGKNKKKMQVQGGLYVPHELQQLKLANGKFYVADGNLDTFNLDGSGYTRIMQTTNVRGRVKYDDASQRVYWQENYGQRFYSCAVYSNKYADCRGYTMFAEWQYSSIIQLPSFVIGNNGMVYFTAQYNRAIYQMDLNIGQPSLKVLVTDPRLSNVYAIATDKARSALFVTTIPSATPSVLRVGFDGTITTLYANIASPYGLLITDLSQCSNRISRLF